MKKFALFFAAVFALMACENKDEITPEITCDVNEVLIPVTIPDEADDITVSFSTNFAWTASLKTEGDAWCAVSPVKGDAGKAIVTLVADSNEGYEPRTATLVITASTAILEIPVVQGQVDAFELVETSAKVGAEGGNVELKAMTNMDWTVEIPAEVTWVKFVESKAYGEQTKTVSVEPFDELDGSREAELVVKCGDASVPFTLTQKGPSSTLWYKSVKSYTEYTGGVQVKLAKYGDKLALLDGNKILVINAATGEYESKIDLPQAMQSLCIDEGGNVLLANDAATGSDMIVYKADVQTGKLTEYIKYNTGNYYCIDTGNLRVKGDITKNAVITAAVSAGAGGALLYWEVKDGVLGNWSYVNIPYVADGVQYEVGVPAGTVASEGLFFIGYKGDYNLYYLANPVKGSDNKWTNVFTTGSSWMENYNCLATAELNGKKYLAYVMGCHFNYDNADVVLLDVTEPTAPVEVYRADCEMFVSRGDDWTNLDWTGEGAFSDVLLVAADGALCIYYIDANFGLIGCQRVLL